MQKTVFILTVLSFSCLVSCTSRYERFSGYAQGGTYTVTYNASGVDASPEELRADVDAILLAIDTTLSGYNPSSQVSRLSRGEKIAPNAILLGIYSRARKYYELTGGALDVASAPLFDIWGFGFTADSLPDEEIVRRTLERCGMDRLPGNLEGAIASGDTIRLNFNSIAQGYSCDAVASYLRSRGVKDMLVDIGEIYCEGLNPSRKPWSIGIDSPFDGNDSPGQYLQKTFHTDGGPCGVVTSGNYRKFYVRDGRKYSHTIDPRTGYPVQHSLLSATIVAPSAELADAWATYCMVVGPDKAREFIEDNGLRGCLITSDGEWSNL